MKNLLIIAFLAVFTTFQPAMAQNTASLSSQVDGTGWNGTNFFDSMTDAELQWILESVNPGDTIILRLRFDSKEMDNTLLANNVKSFDDKVKAKGGKMQYILTISTYKSTSASVMEVANLLDSKGIKFFCVELDNEPYSGEKYNFNFLLYQNDFEPITEAILAKWPTMPISVFVAPRAKDSGVIGGRGDHKNFNDAVFTYINAKPMNWGISVHIYLNEREVPELGNVITKRTVTSTKDADLEGRYLNCLDPVYYRTALSLFDSTMNYLYERAPGRFIYVTEWQYNESSTSKNMIWNSMASLIIWNYVEKFPNALFLEHMGKGNTNAGNISKASVDFDLNPKNYPMLRRTNYWTYMMYRRNDAVANGEFKQGMTFSQPGTYTYWYVNKDNAFTPTINTAPGITVEDFKIQYIAGKYIYSSSGVIYPMARGSLKSMEIDTIKTTSEFSVPAISLGYISFTIENNQVIGCMDTSFIEYDPDANYNSGCVTKKVYGCIDPSFLDYNPNANMSKACTTPKVYGCMDKKAKNYNPRANVSDGSCCYKKWWQFYVTCPTSPSY